MSQQQQDKIFCGSGKKKEFPNGGSITDITIDLGLLENYFQQYGFTTDGGKRMIKLKVSTKRQPDQFGKTHNVEIDTWKPDNNQGDGYNNQNTGNNSYNNYQPGYQGYNNQGGGNNDDRPF